MDADTDQIYPLLDLLKVEPDADLIEDYGEAEDPLGAGTGETHPECNYDGNELESPELKRRRTSVIVKTESKAVIELFSENVPNIEYKSKGPASTCEIPLETWRLLIDDVMLTQIVKFTNDEIRKQRHGDIEKQRTDIVEMRALIGLNYLCGIFRNSANKGPLDELWTSELGNVIFRATMTYKRFRFLMDCLRLSEKSFKSLEHAETIWEKFTINCRSYYSPSDNCAIEELPMYMLKKNERFVCLCDTKTLYLCNALLVLTKAKPEQYILHLASDIKSTPRTIVLEAPHISVDLANKLLKYQLRIIGSLTPTTKDVAKMRTINEPTTIVSDDVTVIYGVDKRISETGILLSSGKEQPIDVTQLYANTVGSCKRFRDLSKTYSTENSRDSQNVNTPQYVFHSILDMACMNAWTLLRMSQKSKDPTMEQRDFQRQLGLYLTQQQLRKRLKMPKTPLPLKFQLCDILGEPFEDLLPEFKSHQAQTDSHGIIWKEDVQLPESVILGPQVHEKRKSCRACRNKTRFCCQQCRTSYCVREMITRCKSCTGVREENMTEISAKASNLSKTENQQSSDVITKQEIDSPKKEESIDMDPDGSREFIS